MFDALRDTLGMPLVALIISIPILFALALVAFRDYRNGLLALVFLLPFENLLALGPAGSVVKYLAGVIALGWFMQTLRDRKPLALFEDPLTVWIAAFVLWSAFSVLWSLDPALATTRLQGYAGNLALFVLIRAAGPKFLPRLWGTLLAGTALTVVLGPLFPVKSEIKLQDGWSRYTTGGQDPNDLAGLLNILIAVALFALLPSVQGRWRRRGLKACVGVMVAAIFLTLSKTGLATFICLLGVYFFQGIRRHKFKLLLASGAIAVGAVLAGDILLEALPGKVGYLDALIRPTRKNSSVISARELVWEASWHTIQANPLLGVGIGNMPVATAHYPGMRIYGTTENSDLGLVAHNTILSVWGELGIVGLLLFLAIIAVCFKRARTLKTTTAWGKALYVSIFLVMVVGMALSWEYKKIFYVVLASISVIWAARESTNVSLRAAAPDKHPLPARS